MKDAASPRKEKIFSVLKRRLTHRTKQKKNFAEVFTPIELIEDMLGHLDDSDWSNPDLTWLDPANGIGNFSVVLFYKLDKGLAKWEPNETLRRKHIIQKMLFMMEKQASNSRVARNIFSSLCDGCEANIWTVDTLAQTKETILEHFGIRGIHRIVGNPPFQAYQKADGKRGGGDELYMKFVKFSLDLLVEGGQLVFVHPPSWRKPEFNEGRKKSKNSGMFELMAHTNHIKYLEMHSWADGMATFHAATRYDFYVIEKRPARAKSLVRDVRGNVEKIDLRQFSFLPNFNITTLSKLLSTDADEACSLENCILYERSAYGTDKAWVSDKKTAEFKYPLIHTTPKSGATLYYSKTKDNGFFGIPKVIFGDSGINDPVIDMTGKYGMTQHAIAIRVKTEREGKRLSRFLKSNFFTNVLTSCMWSNFQIDWRLFTYLKTDFWKTDVDLDEPLIHTKDESEDSRPLNKTRKIRRT